MERGVRSEGELGDMIDVKMEDQTYYYFISDIIR